MKRLLEVTDLKAYFLTDRGVARAVNSIAFYVEVGESIAIVGESGSGKTVSMLSILNLIRPPGYVEGEVWFNNQNLIKLDEAELNQIRGKEIAMVFQEPALAFDPLFTIGSQIMEVLARHKGMGRREGERKVVEILKELGFPRAEDAPKQYPHEYSGGMLQRAMIGMAISCEPKLLIADEPTTNIDVTLEAQILEILVSLVKRLGVSIIYITHNFGIVARCVDRVYVMYGGRIVEEGGTYDLFAKPLSPYTRGLLGSIPHLERSDRSRTIIPGSPPNVTQLPPGCAFWPRCPDAKPICKEKIPEFRQIGSQRVACHLFE